MKKEIDMRSTLDMVKEFEIAFGRPIYDSPMIVDEQLNNLRIRLLQEELDELKAAIADKNVVEVFDALLDIQYILDGTFIELGFWKNKMLGFTEVHNSNMSKLGKDGKPIYREDGKIMKPDHFRKPDLEMYV